jgi:hypothetical protein
MNNKIIIYCDASFIDEKFGWCYKIFSNQNTSIYVLGYGCDTTISSGHAEIESSIRALANISNHNEISLDGIEVVEIRTDFLNLVTFINKRNDPKFEKRLIKGYYNCYSKSLLKLLSIINLMPFNVIAVKVNKKDENLKQVDRYSKYASNNLLTDRLYYYSIVNSNKDIIDIIEDKSIVDYSDYTINKVPHGDEKIRWYNNIKAEIVDIPLNSIDICEEVHLKAENVNFRGNLIKIKEKGFIDIPIAVKANESCRYTLIAGISRLCSAKLLNFNTIPAIVLRDTNHIEFLLKYII